MAHNRMFQQFIYWGVWLIIPLIWEIFKGFISALMVIAKYFLKQGEDKIEHYPTVSVIIPVYNSENTLAACLNSVAGQCYPIDRMEVLLMDNGSRDNSFDVFKRFQEQYPGMRVRWYSSEQGKSKALNKGIFCSSGKYIINIDSDGCLDRNAVKNIVARFESNPRITSLTGVVLIDTDLIEATSGKVLKAFRLCELFEYAEAFLVGRNLQSAFNAIYTMAGAFSCFRREVLFKTQMYNTETLGEDTHMTFQIKAYIGGRQEMCEDAFFFAGPMESLNRIYTQRQRWQRAQLEVAHLFEKLHLGGVAGFITNPVMRKLVTNHTLAFPRLIWYFSVVYLYFINYPLSLLVGANALLYLAYTFNAFLYFIAAGLYLEGQNKTRAYYLRHWYICMILPVYRFIIFWIRVAGIINSMGIQSKWNTEDFSEEMRIVKEGVIKGSRKRLGLFYRVERFVNKD